MTENQYNFACLKTSPTNIGEEIQEIAAMRFLPRIDEFIHREQSHKYTSSNNKKTKCIMNAWWMWRAKNFPPSNDISPLLVSMYFYDKVRDILLTKKSKKYLIENGPVGCRDLSTMNWLKDNGIPAYFTGCMTLTLERNNDIPKEDYILCVDLPKEIVEEIKTRTTRPVIDFNVEVSFKFSIEERFKIAKLFLQTYQSAHCVVSTRLHAILPSLALETPALRLKSEKSQNDMAGRFAGMEHLANTLNVKEFLENKNIYDFESPKENPKDYLKIREDLVERCKKFTNFDKGSSNIPYEKYPFFELLKISMQSNAQNRKILWVCNIKTMIKIIIKRIIFGKTRHDLKENTENLKKSLNQDS